MITLRINGKTVEVDADPDKPLLWVLREDLGLTGSKFGCGVGQCLACLVHLDGQPTAACLTPLAAVGQGDDACNEARRRHGLSPLATA